MRLEIIATSISLVACNFNKFVILMFIIRIHTILYLLNYRVPSCGLVFVHNVLDEVLFQSNRVHGQVALHALRLLNDQVAANVTLVLDLKIEG